MALRPAMPYGRPHPLPGHALLVSIHDVSPLTLDECRRAVDLVESRGIAVNAITLLVIARHEGRLSLERHRPTREWLRQLVDAGACLAMHGLTHRMEGRARGPLQYALARGFARGQGEFLLADRGEFARRVEASRAIFVRAGLPEAIRGFVPPAWLLSRAAGRELERSGFAYYERFGGIVHGDRLRARRLIGFGSLTAVEARATIAYGRWLASRATADTRFAVHPADMGRAATVGAIRSMLDRLRDRLRPVNYGTFLQGSGN